MEPRKYDHATAKAIFEMIGWPESWVIRDDGVFVEDGFRFHSPREKAFDWTPAYDMDWPGAPNPMTAPTLPIKFTARELAASMIDGVGRQIQDALNSPIGYALDDAALQGFGSYHSWVRDALTEAYDVARQAQDVVGELDHDQQQRAYDLLAQYDDAYGQALEHEKVMERVIIGKHKNGNPEYGDFIATGDEYLLRLARAKESVAAQKAQALQAKEQADAALKAWRKAMVRQLLQPQAATPSPAPNLVESEDYTQRWHALRLDEERVKKEEIKIENLSAPSVKEMMWRDERLTALRAELAQIHKRMDFIGSDPNVSYHAENSHVIKGMAKSRRDPLTDADERRQQEAEIAAEIKNANEKIDALIAEATTPSPAPVVPTSDELYFARKEAYARKVFQPWSKARAEKSNSMGEAFIEDEEAIVDEIAELQSEIEDWKSLDCTQPSEKVIKQSNLEPLYARMKELDAIQRLLRGDYGPKVITPSPAPVPQAAPVVAASAPGAVDTDQAGPAPMEQGLPTKDIAHVFDGVNGWSIDRWSRNLSASKWLHPARISIGRAGGTPSVWSPVMLAQLMHDNAKGKREKEKLMKTFNSRFTLNLALRPWRDAFNEYFATHCAID